MEISLFDEFKIEAQNSGILFFYSGEFSSSVITAAGDMLRHRMADHDASSKIKRKVFSTFIEMSQNILHYAAPETIVAGGAPIGNLQRFGNIAVGMDSVGYWIICSNKIDTALVPRITEKLEAIRSMSMEEIKQSYREQLHNTDHQATDEVSKGAGLGLLTIARDISAPLEYGFASSSSNGDSSTTSFHVKAYI